MPSILMSPTMTNETACTQYSDETQKGCNGNSLTDSCSLKRKRPPKIEIPNVLKEIRVETKSTRTEDGGFFCSGGFGVGVGVASVKGKKKLMEDAHKIVSSSNGQKDFFGVYDGHGGSKAAEFVAENLHSNIFKLVENCSENSTREEAVKAGYLKTDEEFLRQDISSGVCCVTALIERREIVISNLGDCRAVLCRGGFAEVLTKDHTAAQEDEQKRIENKGGYVEKHRGAWRVHGVLSVSRSIGDAHLKDWVVAEPDTKTFNLTPDMEYLVLASDGLWTQVDNQEAVNVVTRASEIDKKKGSGAIDGEIDNKFETSNAGSPSSKRISLVKQKRRIVHSITSCKKKTVDIWKENEGNFGSENESPPSKARRVSLVNQIKVKTEYPDQEKCKYKKRCDHDGLVVACKELVNVALARGSLDDITVMIIDLNHFKE